MKQTYHKLFLEEVTIRDFKSIEDLHLKLNKGLNILIGKNGSGKSNFFESLNDALSNQGYRKVGFKSVVLQFVADNGAQIRVELDKVSKNTQLEFSDDFVEYISSRARTSIKIYIDGEKIYDNIILPTGLNKKQPTTSISTIFRKLSYNRLLPKYLTFHLPNTLECIDIAGTFIATFDSDGDVSWSDINTLSLVDRAYWYFKSDTRYEQENVSSLNREAILKSLIIPFEVKESLRMYSPISDIRYGENINVYHEEKGLTIENIKLEFKINKAWLPWSQLSDGTKRIFYIISEILTHPGSMILLEEPELGVHPHQFGQIMEFIREAASHRQIIISTHSPIALNHLKADELDKILIAKYDPKKGTQIRHLGLSQKKKGKIYMERIGQLSDFWTLSDLE